MSYCCSCETIGYEIGGVTIGYEIGGGIIGCEVGGGTIGWLIWGVSGQVCGGTLWSRTWLIWGGMLLGWGGGIWAPCTFFNFASLSFKKGPILLIMCSAILSNRSNK